MCKSEAANSNALLPWIFKTKFIFNKCTQCRLFSLTKTAAIMIFAVYWHKRKYLHSKRVQVTGMICCTNMVRLFIAEVCQYNRCDVMWKHSISVWVIFRCVSFMYFTEQYAWDWSTLNLNWNRQCVEYDSVRAIGVSAKWQFR